MIILYPHMLWGLIGLVPLVGLHLYQYRRARKQLVLFGRQWNTRSMTTVLFIKWFGQTVLLVLFYMAMIFSLAEFHWGDQPVDEDRRDLDIIFLVDVSRSMLAEDIGQSRLDGTKEFILGIMQEFSQARFSLIAFRGDAVQMVPLTENQFAMEYGLQYLSPGVVTAPGTDIERALLRALSFMPEGSDRHRVLVLLSDGEALTGSLEAVAPRYNRIGMPIIALGFGTPGGAGIPTEDGLLLHPQTGEVVITRLDSQRLIRAAELSSGIYIDSQEPGAFLQATNWIHNLKGTRGAEGFRLILIPRFGLFSSLALIFLLLILGLKIIKIRGVL